MDLHQRSLLALDWPVILENLAAQTRTTTGAARARQLPLATDLRSAKDTYVAVREVLRLDAEGEHLPVGLVDIERPVEQCARGATLEAEGLFTIRNGLIGLAELRRYLYDRNELAPRLWQQAESIEVDPDLLQLLVDSFDALGELSVEMYPELGALRAKVRSLRERIRTTLEEILKSESFGEVLQDHYYTEREGRFVVPVKVGYRRGLGIVHGTSQSGETAYVEPAAVVEIHNDLRETESALLREEQRILGMLSRQVGLRIEPLRRSLDAAYTLDLFHARAMLGVAWKGVIPELGAEGKSEGTLLLYGARHPVLSLRGIEVIANDLRLDAACPGLVLSGPNTGGKTVALKTLGLFALLARAGIPVPAKDGTRVDFFDPIIADIGDLQSVEADLSTFSGHVTVLNAALKSLHKRRMGLVLLDEIAVGTDPAQGAALARAVLEAVIEAGSRVACTTHYSELKVLPLSDPRFAAAAVQYEDGRPTYRVAYGVPGSSHALAIARRLGLPETVLERARTLLDAGARALTDAMERLEAERNRVHEQGRHLANRERDLAAREQDTAERAAQIAERARNLRQEVVSAWRERMKEKEDEVRALVAALQAAPDMKGANATLQTIRSIRQALEDEPVPPPAAPPALGVGDQVRHRTLGLVGKIVAISDERVELQAGIVRTWVARADVEPISRRQARKQERSPPLPAPVISAPTAVRTSSNTLDLRGQRVEDALDLVDLFLDKMRRSNMGSAYLLHGHGTGALKEAIRAALPRVRHARSFRAATAEEGGDAFTYVELG